jgi:hypothetical protein
MRTRFGMLFVVAFVSMLGAGPRGGVQDQVQEQVDQEVQGVQDQAEEAVQGGARRWKSRYRRDGRKSKGL